VSGITEKVLDDAEAWLVGHGHSMTGITYDGPGGAETRGLAALALHLNVFTASELETVELIVDTLAYVRSEGRTCQHVLKYQR
jgi:hypothetical protein